MSQLEEMVSALQQRAAKPKVLPGLPPRPIVRGRLPSPKRSLPINTHADRTEEENALKQQLEIALRLRVFGTKRTVKLDEPEESPYATRPVITNYKGRLEHDNTLDSDASRLPSTKLLDEKFRWNDTTGKKVIFDSSSCDAIVFISFYLEFHSPAG